jgi:hypothetical protein
VEKRLVYFVLQSAMFHFKADGKVQLPLFQKAPLALTSGHEHTLKVTLLLG